MGASAVIVLRPAESRRSKIYPFAFGGQTDLSGLLALLDDLFLGVNSGVFQKSCARKAPATSLEVSKAKSYSFPAWSSTGTVRNSVEK